jgi:tetratricopeptide (TPR) repeat protein
MSAPPRLWPLVALALPLGGCAGELTAFAVIAGSMALSTWAIVSGRRTHAMLRAQQVRLALGRGSGEHREIELRLRKELALVEAGEAVGPEREWLARVELAGLLVAEWRLDEAAAVYGTEQPPRAPHLQALAAFGRHELDVLTRTPDAATLAAIHGDRDRCIGLVPAAYREDVGRTWSALEGLALVRMGRAREGAAAIERGLPSLELNPAKVVYLFHLGQALEAIGDLSGALARYGEASAAFPGTRLASEAAARRGALGAGDGGRFRGMLPEAPEAAEDRARRTDEAPDDPDRDG